MKYMNSDDIVRLAACPVCAAFRKERCTFNRMEDPEMLRTTARQSHDARVILARKYFDLEQPIPLDIPGFRL